MADKPELLTVAGREVRVTHPDKPYFSREVEALASSTSSATTCRSRTARSPASATGPIVLKRFVDGAEGEPFYQKRAPEKRPDWLRTVTLSFPSGRTAEEVVVDDAAGLAWIVNLGCIELHPHPVRAGDLDHPDELRIDLDPGPGRGVGRRAPRGDGGEGAARASWACAAGRRPAARAACTSTCASQPRWTFTEVRRAALALSREIERRAPTLATSKWWKEERHGVFLDYNQNAKDRTTCSAYSVRPLPDARVSAPLDWDEVPDCEPADFTVLTMPARFAAIGDPHAGMDDAAGSLDALLELAARDEAAGPRRRAVAAALPRRWKARRRASRRRARKRAAGGSEARAAREDAADRRRQLARQGGRAGGPRALEGAPPAGGRAAGGRRRAGRLMRGRSSTWTRIRVNLRNVPEAMRPPQETPDPDDDPTREWRAAWRAAKTRAALRRIS